MRVCATIGFNGGMHMAKETKRTQLDIVIDARMKERGITAEQLADAVGVDVA